MGDDPHSVAIGDLDGDGAPDLATANCVLQRRLGAPRHRPWHLRRGRELPGRRQTPFRRHRRPRRRRRARPRHGGRPISIPSRSCSALARAPSARPRATPWTDVPRPSPWTISTATARSTSPRRTTVSGTVSVLLGTGQGTLPPGRGLCGGDGPQLRCHRRPRRRRRAATSPRRTSPTDTVTVLLNQRPRTSRATAPPARPPAAARRRSRPAASPSATMSTGFVVAAATVEGQKDGLFFFGTNGPQANPWGNGTSYQCVVPPVMRAGLLLGAGTNGACDGAFDQDLNAHWCPTCPKPGHNPGAGAGGEPAALVPRPPEHLEPDDVPLRRPRVPGVPAVARARPSSRPRRAWRSRRAGARGGSNGRGPPRRAG